MAEITESRCKIIEEVLLLIKLHSTIGPRVPRPTTRGDLRAAGRGFGCRAGFAGHRLTLARRLEAEGLEAAGEGGGVDDVDAVLALAPPVESDGDDQQHHRHHPGRQARVQGHVAAAAALHAWEGRGERERDAIRAPNTSRAAASGTSLGRKEDAFFFLMCVPRPACRCTAPLFHRGALTPVMRTLGREAIIINPTPDCHFKRGVAPGVGGAPRSAGIM